MLAAFTTAVSSLLVIFFSKNNSADSIKIIILFGEASEFEVFFASLLDNFGHFILTEMILFLMVRPATQTPLKTTFCLTFKFFT